MPNERLAHDYPGLTMSPSFTLGTALSWLGHDCRGGCPESMTATRATVWFTRLGPACSLWTHTLVEVEFTDSPWSAREVRALGSEVNMCVHGDHLRVREVRTTGRGSSAVTASFGLE